MNQDIEIISIAIPTSTYNLHIANLIEHLLLIDQAMFPEQTFPNPTEAA